MRKALYAGSFDPITDGHMWVIGTASQMFDELIVVVAQNHEKKTLFTAEERVAQVTKSCEHYSNVEIQLMENEYTVNFAKEYGARFLIRGIRNSSDFEYEKALTHVNESINSDIISIYLIPPQELEGLSSSMVKGLIGPKGWRKIVASKVPAVSYQGLVNKKAESLFPRQLASFGLWSLVKENYTAQNRYYHTLEHILHCLEEYSEYRTHSPYNNLRWYDIESAIWMHDVIYDPKAADNEEKSSKTIANLSNSGLNGTYVAEMIMATKTHEPKTEEEKIVCDVDLSILGQKFNIYAQYAENIRFEYSHIPAKDFNKARAKFMKQFLERKKIFRTSYFFDKYEKIARSNIEIELKYL